MNKVIGATLIAVAALAGTAALAAGDNHHIKQRAEIKALWGKTAPAKTGQVSVSREGEDRGIASFLPSVFDRSGTAGTQWKGNFRAGKVHRPADR